MPAFLSNEDKLVISKAKDTMYLADKRRCSCFYGFLNEHETQIIKNNLHLDENCLFWGGYDNAQRVFFSVNCKDKTEFPFLCACFTYKKEYKLTHRDFLGALMSLGVERSTIGDILVGDGATLVFIKSDVFDYISSQLDKIGKVGVKITINCESDISFDSEIEALSFTVASNRLDAFVAGVCHISREQAQRMIKTDLVSLNHCVNNNVSHLIDVGDIIKIRKYGKFEFAGIDGLSKKGRLRLTVNHFR